MTSLENEGYFELTKDELAKLQEDFVASFATDSDCEEIIKEYSKIDYLMCPHTATAVKAYKSLDFKNPVVAYSTAEWTKFAPSIHYALTGEDVNREVLDEGVSDKDAIAYIETNLNVKAPQMILELFEKEENVDVISKETIKENIIKFL